MKVTSIYVSIGTNFNENDTEHNVRKKAQWFCDVDLY